MAATKPKPKRQPVRGTKSVDNSYLKKLAGSFSASRTLSTDYEKILYYTSFISPFWSFQRMLES
jgi:hypothetical protein